MPSEKTSKGEKIVDIIEKIIDRVFILFFTLILLFCAYAIYDSATVYEGANLSKEVLANVKEENNTVESVDLEALRKINDELIAWISIDNSEISFPVMQSEDDRFYLTHDIYRNYAFTGSIFMSSKNAGDFSDDYSLIYGHNMNGQKMFGSLSKWSDEAYFDSHTHGKLFTPDGTYDIELIAYLETTKDNNLVYKIENTRSGYNNQILAELDANAIHNRGYDENAQILALSTCLGQGGDRALLFFNFSKN